MITLEASVICDTCKAIIASGDTTEHIIGINKGMFSAVESAASKAKAHGARIGISTAMCADCLAKRPTKTT